MTATWGNDERAAGREVHQPTGAAAAAKLPLDQHSIPDATTPGRYAVFAYTGRGRTATRIPLRRWSRRRDAEENAAAAMEHWRSSRGTPAQMVEVVDRVNRQPIYQQTRSRKSYGTDPKKFS